MKYYIYLSESKVSMLYAQISQCTGVKREASLGFDIKLLKGHIKESRGIPEHSFAQLDEVISALNKSDLVGTVKDPKEYIGGCLSMTWCTFGGSFGDKKSPITFWGYCEESHYPFSGTVMALAGSKYHLLGEQRAGRAHSHSGTPMMIQWFLENLDDPFENSEESIKDAKHYVGEGAISNDDVTNGAWLAATQAKGHTAKYDFVAKVLHKSDWPEGFRSKTNRVILGSPLYVAFAE
jgi:hypothetical protein